MNNVNYQNNNDLYLLLNKYDEKMYDSLLSFINPIIGSINYIKKLRKYYLVNKEMVNINKNKEELLNFLFPILPKSSTYEAYYETSDKIKMVQKEEIFEGSFTKLNKLFKELNTQDRINLIINTNSSLTRLFNQIERDLIDNILITENRNEALILTQAFHSASVLTEEIKGYMEKTPPSLKDARLLMTVSIVLLVKILFAQSRKIEYNSLYRDIAFVNMVRLKNPLDMSDVDDDIFAVFEG